MADEEIKNNPIDRKSLYIKIFGITNEEFDVQC